MTDTTKAASTRWVRYGKGGALVAGGLLAGGILTGTIAAGAATSSTATPSGPESGTTQDVRPSGDPSQPQRSDEELLSGTTADKVRETALAEYPGATIERVETDSEGVYEAHVVTTSGEHVTVQVGSDFTVTGVQSGAPRGHGGPGRPGGGQETPAA